MRKIRDLIGTFLLVSLLMFAFIGCEISGEEANDDEDDNDDEVYNISVIINYTMAVKNDIDVFQVITEIAIETEEDKIIDDELFISPEETSKIYNVSGKSLYLLVETDYGDYKYEFTSSITSSDDGKSYIFDFCDLVNADGLDLSKE